MPTLETDVELERVMVPLGPMLTALYRVWVSALLCCIVSWLVVLCLLVVLYGTKVERFLDGIKDVRVAQVEVKTAGGSGPASAGARPDAGGT